MEDFVKTSGDASDFIMLSKELDQLFAELAHDKDKLARVGEYNDPTDVETAFIAYVGGEPVGCIGLKKYDGEHAELKRLFLKEEYRGRGLSQKLVAAVEEEARSRGFRYMLLQTARALASAVALYEKSGYEVIENYGPYVGMAGALCMEKKL